MNPDDLMNWVLSLNPIHIRTDEEGNFHPDDLQSLKSRLKGEIEKAQKQSEPDTEPSEPDA